MAVAGVEQEPLALMVEPHRATVALEVMVLLTASRVHLSLMLEAEAQMATTIAAREALAAEVRVSP